MALTEKLHDFITTIELTSISAEREQALQPLVDYLRDKVAQSAPIQLTFICTHNSRRSCFAQVWAQVLAAYFGLENVQCFSGGTEATALPEQVVKTLRDSGLQVDQMTSGVNPKYHLTYADDAHPVQLFSKTWQHHSNPKSHFAALMTCAEASANCPVIPGAELRIPLPFEDPKHYDHTAQQSAKYAAVNRQIATALYAVYSKIN